MKRVKFAAVFMLFFAAVCRAQVNISAWSDLNNFIGSASDTNAVFTGDVFATGGSTDNSSNHANTANKTIDGGGYTLSGAGNPTYMNIGLNPPLASATTVSNITFTGFTYTALMNNDYNYAPVTARVTIGPNVVFDHNGGSSNSGHLGGREASRNSFLRRLLRAYRPPGSAFRRCRLLLRSHACSPLSEMFPCISSPPPRADLMA